MSLDRLAQALRSFIPDPFAIAIGLTVVAFIAAVGSGGDPLGVVDAWVGGYVAPDAPPDTKPLGGVWSMLTFAMQMCLILVTGFVVASTGPVRLVIGWLSSVPRSTAQAAAMVSVVAMLLALLNWGLGLIAGALLAREVGLAMRRAGRPVHYPLLAAAGYSGLAVWHGGLSGSAPLKVTDAANLTEVLGSEIAASVGAMPLSTTVLSPRNLITTGLVVVCVPIVLAFMSPRDEASFQGPPPADAADDVVPPRGPGVSGWIESTPVLSLILAALIGVWAVRWAAGGGLLKLNPNSMNFSMLMVGLVLAGSPLAYMHHAQRAARACAGIIVQFPLYGGILGVLAAGGLVDALAGAMPTGAGTLSVATFFSAGVVNLFVPSGGGQWTVQGPIVMEAAINAGVEPSRVLLALCYGDQWTNLFQPFWALPLLGITGTRASDILGYTAILGVVVGVIFAAGVTLF
jgi:short-chain fatty acids transporter